MRQTTNLNWLTDSWNPIEIIKTQWWNSCITAWFLSTWCPVSLKKHIRFGKIWAQEHHFTPISKVNMFKNLWNYHLPIAIRIPYTTSWASDPRNSTSQTIRWTISCLPHPGLLAKKKRPGTVFCDVHVSRRKLLMSTWKCQVAAGWGWWLRSSRRIQTVTIRLVVKKGVLLRGSGYLVSG